MQHGLTLVASVVFLFGCATTAPLNGYGPTPPGGDHGTAFSDWVPEGDAFRLSFFDGRSAESITAVGPYRVLAASDRGLELQGQLEGADGAAWVRVFRAGEAVWAQLRADDREFLR